MPDLTFDVDSYTVSTSQSGASSAGALRVLNLTGVALSHGIREHASIYFTDDATATTAGAVLNVDQPNYNGRSAYAYARKADYDDWYDLLRNERPLTFSCSYGGPTFDPSRPSRTIYGFSLYTGQQEPLGEGPEGTPVPLRIQAVTEAHERALTEQRGDPEHGEARRQHASAR